MTDSQYEDFLKQHNSRGRKKKIFNYGNQVLYQILDECKIREHNRKYIFRVPFVTLVGNVTYRENFTSKDAELIITREPLRFKDILVYNNNYEFFVNMSKQETVNTFDGGLIMDLNPIVTPNNVLTGALNATSITYDGNEFVLQNDMGNGEVHTARLDKGYILLE